VLITSSFVGTTTVHDAHVSWVETITLQNFTACVSKTPDFGTGFTDGKLGIEWIVVKGSPGSMEVGEELISDWTVQRCVTAKFAQEYNSPPRIQASVNHRLGAAPSLPPALWIEKVTTTDFHVCLADVGSTTLHSKARINWIAFSSAMPGLAKEIGYAHVSSSTDLEVQCSDIPFTDTFDSPPTILITLMHESDGDSGLHIHEPAVAWVEGIQTSNFTYCVRPFRQAMLNHEGLKIEWLARLPRGSPTAPEIIGDKPGLNPTFFIAFSIARLFEFA
jgi:hypothetical protein